ncbi:hypothetical protein Bcav_0616 [Beutenbergia cavernae DSM 12333]|uniref:Uncharacterized protein n=1 Tax=Beutenbergia cavernae (strain ATCC BAA-8 / DSM 12333 / CCUG 43141 / JCM 11478 / NBRC 16432 / NCIMB 13614 / HKI 0122) TaxID=471853 RepID=C5BXY4_BEUC1|nr:hypothetical protein [Beutenbergia cavernae]ACQ78878.1 hypothetical protein Bcav_0616 [Beutenbergia cavernae DSM 12333]
MTAPPATVPVPPRSRVAAHLVGTALALVVAPFAWLACAGAAGAFAEGAADGGGAPPSAVVALLAGALVLAGIVAWAARSAVAAIVVGATYGVAAALVHTFARSRVNTVTDALPETWLDLPVQAGAELLFRAQAPVLVGGVMLAAGITAFAARRAGRYTEREDARRTAALGATTAPRPRIVAHVVSVVVGAVGTPVLLATAGAFTAATLMSESRTRVAVVALAGALAVAVVVGIAAVSSLGAFVAGALWVIAGLGYLAAPDGARSLLAGPVTRIEELLLGEPVGDAVHALGATGTVLLVGVVLLGAGVAAHGARRDGRNLERSEIALVRDRDAVVSRPNG